MLSHPSGVDNIDVNVGLLASRITPLPKSNDSPSQIVSVRCVILGIPKVKSTFIVLSHPFAPVKVTTPEGLSISKFCPPMVRTSPSHNVSV